MIHEMRHWCLFSSWPSSSLKSHKRPRRSNYFLIFFFFFANFHFLNTNFSYVSHRRIKNIVKTHIFKVSIEKEYNKAYKVSDGQIYKDEQLDFSYFKTKNKNIFIFATPFVVITS